MEVAEDNELIEAEEVVNQPTQQVEEENKGYKISS